MVSDESRDDYVVCSACGTRMRATRERCLRCFEPLNTTVPPPVWRTLTVSDHTGIVAGTIAMAVVIGFAWLLWATSPPAWVREAESAATNPPPASSAAGVAQASGALAVSSPAPARPASGERDVDSTRQEFEEKLKANPDDAVAMNGLGLVLERQGTVADAATRFRRATELAPDRVSYRVNLASAEGRLGEWARAVADYREAATISPDDYGVRYNLGVALHHTGDDEAAVAQFEVAIRLSPNEATAYRTLGVSLEATGRIDEAVEAYQRYIDLAPGTEETQQVRRHAEQLPAGSRRVE